MKRFLCFIALAISMVGFPAYAQEAATTTAEVPEEPVPVVLQRGQDGQYERGLVESVTTAAQDVPSGGAQVQVFQIRLLSGPIEGQVRELRSDVGDNPYGLTPRKGDRVVIFMQPSGDGGWLLFLESFDRRGALVWLAVLFVLTLVLLSGWQGLKTAFSIFVSILLIGGVLIPLFIQGLHPVPIAILLSGVLTLLSTGLSTGWNRKSFVTAFGTMGGALIAYIVSLVFVDWAHLNGLATDEDRIFFQKNPNLDPRGLLFAGIIIAAAGVLEDVAVSITSGISEVRRMSPRASFRELFTSGMVVGKDHMSALANTLVFAYVGASLSSLLLYQQFGGSWLKFINFDSVADEVVRSLAGTIGLIFTVPITALLAAWAVRQGPLSETPDPHAGHKH